MAIAFFIVLGILTVMTLVRPKTDEDMLEQAPGIELVPAPGAKLAGGLVVLATVALYVVFW